MPDRAPDTTTGSQATRDWRHSASCADQDPELFFPVGNVGQYLLQIEEAKAVCYRCPVMEQCLQWALETGQDAGVWGGLSEDERRAMKRRRARNQPKAEPKPKPAPKKPREPATCPSRAMYRKHRQAGEDCEPCRIANSQADRRLRNTGTTKEVAS